MKLILCKLDSLETKLKTVIETVSNLTTTVNKLENVVDKVQGDAKKLRDDIYAMDKGVSFLNSEVQELGSKEGVHLERIKGLEDQIMYLEFLVVVSDGVALKGVNKIFFLTDSLSFR